MGRSDHPVIYHPNGVVSHQAPPRPQVVMPRPLHAGVSYMQHAPSLNLAVPIREPTPEPQIVSKSEAEDVAEPTTANDDDDGLEDGEIDIQIRNVVCNYTLPLHIDLRKLALCTNNVTFDRGRGVLLKQKRNPNCYVKIYSSGKVYIVGCKSEADCMTASRSVARRVQKAMQKLHESVKIRNFKVCNVLATCRMPFGIKIEELAQKYPAQSQYEPELSVGLVWRSEQPKATLRIHTTGSITVTGASSEADVMQAIENIYPIVRQFRCAMRHRENQPAKTVRKRIAPSVPRQPPVKRFNNSPPQRTSGLIGNRVYFSDEDDDYDDDMEDVV
ncbi:unnamed protein product [Auanema sp. JU1783]|nr:unnamed protein product [Auanema sp. JU1783]